jgi:hypothetical protein
MVMLALSASDAHRNINLLASELLKVLPNIKALAADTNIALLNT